MKFRPFALAACMLATAAVVAPRTGYTQKQVAPSPIAPVAPVAPVAPIKVTGAPALKAAIAAQALAPIALSTTLDTITDLDGRMFGAAPNAIVALEEDGTVRKTFPTKIARAAISPHTAGALVVGDLTAKAVFTFDVSTGALKPLLRLADVRDAATDKAPGAHLLSHGALAGVASDGKSVYVGVQAGFSSAIFKIDPTTKQIVERAWAAAADPGAMVAANGGLFVLVDGGGRVRRFTDALGRSREAIDLPSLSAKGIGVRKGELRLLDQSRVARVTVPESELSRGIIQKSIDTIVVAPIKLRPPIKIPPILLARRFAVLITGDLAENFSGECFWNDTVWMYKALLANGYEPDKIFVLYGDGADFASPNPSYQHPTTVTDFAATPANVNAVFDGLANGDATRGIPKMTDLDSLFVWTFDHGGRSGTESTLVLRGGSLTASAFSTKLNAVPYSRRAVFMQQCFSGGFIDPLKNDKTFISTAARADEVARPADTENEMVGGRTYSHGEFDYHVITALNRLTPGNAAINADGNTDAHVSALEMHQWNVARESRPETPQMSDLGGVGASMKWKK